MAIVEIPLTQGKVAIIDAEDLPLIRGYKWYAAKSCHCYYAMAEVAGIKPRKRIKMHRVILGMTNPREKADHRDGNGLNNRRTNLRRATNQQNGQNRRKIKPTASRFKGVHRGSDGTFWVARIRVSKHKLLHLGCFKDEQEAAKAYDTAARKHFGEFANVNFPYQ